MYMCVVKSFLNHVVASCLKCHVHNVSCVGNHAVKLCIIDIIKSCVIYKFPHSCTKFMSPYSMSSFMYKWHVSCSCLVSRVMLALCVMHSHVYMFTLSAINMFLFEQT